jgi:putative isomerase
MKPIKILLAAVLIAITATAEVKTPLQQYQAIQSELAKGWNTWDTRSVLTHVYLPYAFGVQLSMIDSQGHRRGNFRIGERGKNAPLLTPGPHSYDGKYTKVVVDWGGHKILVESAAKGLTNILLITPLEGNTQGGTLVVNPTALWMRGVRVDSTEQGFKLANWNRSVSVEAWLKGNATKKKGNEWYLSLDTPSAICIGSDMTLQAAHNYVSNSAKSFEEEKRKKFGTDYDSFNAMQSVLGWNSIYDPGIRKIITPVSRIWSSSWFASDDFGGFTLFCWDTYFASMMLGATNKGLAYANCVEITNALTEQGFVPNSYYSNGFKSRDRSQPPVGSMATWTLYTQYKDEWLLELLYDKLLTWNRWWDKNRSDKGLLCLGSSVYDKVTYFRSEYDTNTRYGAILESGLDNSPMYDQATFNTRTHLLEQNDVGMTSLYVMDCDYLAKIAAELGKQTDVNELKARGDRYRSNLAQLWDEQKGFYYNRSTKTMELNYRCSPTSFYPLLAKAATAKQAKRMINEHLLNKKEFWGDYIIPSTPRNDPAFKNNEYWRGRIWAPLNFLVYMGLRNYDMDKVRHHFAERSRDLLLKSWNSHGYVFENYNAVTGVGDDVERSDKFYHWGALLGYIWLIENGKINI